MASSAVVALVTRSPPSKWARLLNSGESRQIKYSPEVTMVAA
jgi:hypothetical protein